MPLYVTNGKLQLGEPGKLAAQRACCCNDPGDCICPDFCAYDIEIISPVLQKLGPLNCDSPGDIFGSKYFETSGSGGANWDIIDCANCSATGLLSSQLTRYLPNINFFLPAVPWGLFPIGVGARAIASSCRPPCPTDLDVPCTYGGPHIEDNIYVGASGQASATVAVYCIDNKFYLTAYWSTTGNTGGDVQGYYNLVRSATFSLFSECKVQSANKWCGGLAFLGSEIQSLTISVDESGTSLGPWQEEFLTKIPEQREGPFQGPGCTPGQVFLDASLAETIAEQGSGFSASFSITRRSSCRIVDCNCSTDVCGLVADVRAYPGGPLVEWILCKPEEEQSRDREFSCTIEGVSYTCLYKYRELTETKNGVSVSIHRFIYERFANPPDVSGFPRERKVADLWCDGDGWMMDFQTVCIKVDLDTGFGGGYEEDRVVGEILCGPACGNDGSSRAPGDPIPLGSAVEVIGVPGFPYSEGELSCDIGLGERMSVEIRQTLTC